jgi:hypothetical protein
MILPKYRPKLIIPNREQGSFQIIIQQYGLKSVIINQ